MFQNGKVQSKLGLLMLLCTWLSHCVLAVKQFLSIPTSIPYLTGQVRRQSSCVPLGKDIFQGYILELKIRINSLK